MKVKLKVDRFDLHSIIISATTENVTRHGIRRNSAMDSCR